MRGRASKRAWKFERKLKEDKGENQRKISKEIAKKHLEEMKERWKKRKIIGKWERERKKYMEKMGVEI